MSSFNVQKSERACVFKEMCTNRLNGRSVLIFVCVCEHYSAFHANCLSDQRNECKSDIRSMIRLLAIFSTIKSHQWPTICKNFFSMTLTHTSTRMDRLTHVWQRGHRDSNAKIARNLCMILVKIWLAQQQSKLSKLCVQLRESFNERECESEWMSEWASEGEIRKLRSN